MIDTHAHLSSRFREEIKIEGLDWIILSASCLQDSKDNLELAKNNKKLLPAIGIHPQEIKDKIEELEKLMSDEVIAIGECGLEFTDEVNDTDKQTQIEIFKKQIEMSQKYNKPLIVHSREASDETLEILKNYEKLKGVIHCYSGGKKRIKKVMELGENWYFGIDGNITYEIGLEQIVKEIPKNRLILETDSPFLTPVPHRGEKNFPEYIKFVYQKIAEIWGMSFEETEKIIDENAKRLFKIV
jgi:TatD DNase family protein